MEDEKKSKEHSEPDQEEFSFLQEIIKEEPVTKKKILLKAARLAAQGLIFGLAASLGFFALKPWAEKQFGKDEDKVTISKDQEEPEEEVPEEEVIQVEPVLTIESYKELSKALNQVAATANKSVVEVVGGAGREDWMNQTYDTVNSVSGVIIADNGHELLILADSSILKETEKVSVIFNDGRHYQASLKKKDDALRIAIFSVGRDAIADATWNSIQIATLGNSNVVRKGDPVIALGKQFGYAGGMGIGTVSSIKSDMAITDGSYQLLLTDIAGTPHGTGILVNMAGEVIGIIKQDIARGESIQLTNALALSEIKDSIELLSNGSGVPYIGIVGSEITEDTAVAQKLERGVYVREAEIDSPAMAAGIQSGDIITEIAGERVTTFTAYRAKIMERKVGDSVDIKGKRMGTNGYVDISFHVTIGSKEK